MSETATIILNMIVKNESRTISRLLESVIDQVDVIVISDTGSTDNTKEVVSNIVATRNPPPLLHWLPDTPFRDFAHNRNYSLKGCVDWWRSHNVNTGNSTYILLLDADMVFQQTGMVSLPDYLAAADKQHIDVFQVFQGTPSYYYHNTRIIRDRVWDNCSYNGVTHEYLNIEGSAEAAVVSTTDFFINDIGDGGAKGDKFERDIKLLTNGLIAEPNNERYIFYLANSFRDAGRLDEAIETYKRRIDARGWFEEVWYSYYEIGNCYEKLGDMEHAISFWLKAFDYNDYRAESLYQIVKYYCRACNYRLAHHFYKIAKGVCLCVRDNILFYNKGMHTYLLDFEYTIFAHYYNPDGCDLMAAMMSLLCHPIIDDSTKNGVYYNFKFQTMKLLDFTNKKPTTPTPLLQFIREAAIIVSKCRTADDIDVAPISSTPTILFNHNDNTLYLNVRFVNYKIESDTGNYIRKENIVSQNWFLKVNATITTPNDNCLVFNATPTLLQYNRVWDCQYIGLEDVRFLLAVRPLVIVKQQPEYDVFTGCIKYGSSTVEIDKSRGEFVLLYNCNRGIEDDRITVETGIIECCKSKTTNETIFSNDKAQMTEKNWVMFQYKDACKFVYKWGDAAGNIVIGEKSEDNRLCNFQYVKAPPFFRDLRGSSNGVLIGGDQLWFICHLVSYESRRHYYHCFVVLHYETLELMAYSKFWTFEGSPVEYCVSFIENKELGDSGGLILGYSIMDCSTKFMEIDMASVRQLLIPYATTPL
jgi:glycosyltransferase involved in cell wall biosynthesis